MPAMPCEPCRDKNIILFNLNSCDTWSNGLWVLVFSLTETPGIPGEPVRPGKPGLPSTPGKPWMENEPVGACYFGPN